MPGLYRMFFAALLSVAILSSAATNCDRNITFFGPWVGGDAYLVNYTGPYENDRPPHVQVGLNSPVTAGLFACLTNIRAATKEAIEWDVEGVWNNALNDEAHFTVYYGADAKSKVDEFR